MRVAKYSIWMFRYIFILVFSLFGSLWVLGQNVDWERVFDKERNADMERRYFDSEEGTKLAISDIVSSPEGFQALINLDGCTPWQYMEIIDSIVAKRMFLRDFIMYSDTFIYTNLSDGTDDIMNYPYYYAFDRSKKNKRILMEFLLDSSYLAECGLMDVLSVMNRKVIYSWFRGEGYEYEYSREDVFEKVQSTLSESNDSHSVDCLDKNLDAIYR